MTTDCSACVLALTETHHEYRNGCRGCEIRAMSNDLHICETWLNTLPKEAREQADIQAVVEWRRTTRTANNDFD